MKEKDKLKRIIQKEFLKTIKIKNENTRNLSKYLTCSRIEKSTGIPKSTVHDKTITIGTESLSEILILCTILNIDYKLFINFIVELYEENHSDNFRNSGNIRHHKYSE